GPLRVQVRGVRGTVRPDAFDERGQRVGGVSRVRQQRVAASYLQLRLRHPRRLRHVYQPHDERSYGRWRRRWLLRRWLLRL
ncbi:MAG: hypothetical protein AVDCRST_MAG14-568, partial [uncultured Rubrobacteraceae bacterium]